MPREPKRPPPAAPPPRDNVVLASSRRDYADGFFTLLKCIRLAQRPPLLSMLRCRALWAASLGRPPASHPRYKVPYDTDTLFVPYRPSSRFCRHLAISSALHRGFAKNSCQAVASAKRSLGGTAQPLSKTTNPSLPLRHAQPHAPNSKHVITSTQRHAPAPRPGPAAQSTTILHRPRSPPVWPRVEESAGDAHRRPRLARPRVARFYGERRRDEGLSLGVATAATRCILKFSPSLHYNAFLMRSRSGKTPPWRRSASCSTARASAAT